MHVKICGVTSVADALMCVGAGASAIGINLVPDRPRFVDEETARDIASAIRGRALSVGVVENLSVARMLALRADLGLECLQLHGDETPEALELLLPHAYKALRASDVVRERLYGGAHLLVDGPSPGSGLAFDWSVVSELATQRKLTLAGGLHPGNVADAIRAVAPYCVDVASGVELASDPRRKDPARVAAFIAAARRC